MTTITTTLLRASVIAGAALMLTAMSTMSTARHAFAQDTSGTEASADAESPDTVIDVAGSWSGTITDDDLGAGSIDLTISQTGRTLNGGWMSTFSTAKFLGNFTGHLRDSKGATLDLGGIVPTKKACKVRFTATSISGTAISGNYKYIGCGTELHHDKGGTISIEPTPAM